MAIEQGIVVKFGPHGDETVWVQTTRSSACESCSSRDSCNAGADGNHQEVEVLNTAGAKVGDRIQISVKTSSIIKAMFLLYIFPILCMLGGGIAGNWGAARFNANPSVLAAIAAFLCFGAALVVVRISGQRMGGKEAYRPRIIRILGKGSLPTAQSGLPIECAGNK